MTSTTPKKRQPHPPVCKRHFLSGFLRHMSGCMRWTLMLPIEQTLVLQICFQRIGEVQILTFLATPGLASCVYPCLREVSHFFRFSFSLFQEQSHKRVSCKIMVQHCLFIVGSRVSNGFKVLIRIRKFKTKFQNLWVLCKMYLLATGSKKIRVRTLRTFLLMLAPSFRF